MKLFVGILAILLLTSTPAHAQDTNGRVTVVGARRNVIMKGELGGRIALDTIANKGHLYGLGPVEFMAGELLVVDGRPFMATVASDSTMHVEETFNVKAPFFVYTNVKRWSEQPLPESVRTLGDLESYLDRITRPAKRPFAFRLEGTVQTATIHLQNLPAGTTVTSPDQIHHSRKDYHIKEAAATLIGFFSTEHQGIFTHHDSFIHIHLITADETMMGHLDDLEFTKDPVKLLLPQN